MAAYGWCGHLVSHFSNAVPIDTPVHLRLRTNRTALSISARPFCDGSIFLGCPSLHGNTVIRDIYFRPFPTGGAGGACTVGALAEVPVEVAAGAVPCSAVAVGVVTGGAGGVKSGVAGGVMVGNICCTSGFGGIGAPIAFSTMYAFTSIPALKLSTASFWYASALISSTTLILLLALRPIFVVSHYSVHRTMRCNVFRDTDRHDCAGFRFDTAEVVDSIILRVLGDRSSRVRYCHDKVAFGFRRILEYDEVHLLLNLYVPDTVDSAFHVVNPPFDGILYSNTRAVLYPVILGLFCPFSSLLADSLYHF